MADPKRIRVEAPGGSYEIFIEPGLRDRLDERVTGLAVGEPVVVATNTTLRPLYGDRLAAALPNASVVTMPDGEQYKTLDTVAKLYADFVDAGLNRTGTVIALGGGVVGDTVGFAAATYMRGVRLVQMPTSLLAMADSSVGGKVGIDLPQGKNLVGAFKQPEVVLVDTEVLQTLPEREWRCGMAEVIKHGLLADPVLLEMAQNGNFDDLPEFVRRTIQVKVDVVQADPFERGMRAHLNLGHTFAHAIERVSGYAWPHGEAVGVGLLAAARLSYLLGMCDASLPEQVERLLAAVGLPARLGDMDSEAIYAAMGTDKKWQAGQSRFVLLRGVGQPEIVKNAPPESVIEVLTSLK
ncbi:MAG: 3-dehydroquinate synthase [Chloroflexota bacterium]|nr:MAG: 3-dehydroquinate synthase [Chloroflexota bacterium]